MKIVFKEVKQYEQINEHKINHVFDLTSSADCDFLHQRINDQADYIGRVEESKSDSEAYDEVQDEAKHINELISNQNASELGNGRFDYFDFEVIEQTLDEVLEDAGYQVEKSTVSSSIYVKLGNKIVRISNHKRPAVVEGAIAHEWQYDEELIKNDGSFSSQQLSKVGIELKEGVYYLD